MPESPADPRRKLTIAEFEALHLPEREGVFYELLDGEVVVVEGAPSLNHAAVTMNLAFLIGGHLRATGRGEIFTAPTGTVLGEHTITLPDLLVILEENRGICRPDGVYGPPDLVIEIVLAPQHASIRHLLRSTTFNPRDQQLDRDQIELIASALTDVDPVIRQVVAEQTEAEEREFAELHSHGQTTAMSNDQLQMRRQLRAVGSDPVFRVIEDRTFGVSRARMPAASAAKARLHEAGAFLVARLATAFANAGTLTNEEAQVLPMRAIEESDRLNARSRGQLTTNQDSSTAPGR